MMDNFIARNLIPESFKKNVDARIKIYRKIL